MKTLDEVKAAIRKLTPAELSELKMELSSIMDQHSENSSEPVHYAKTSEVARVNETMIHAHSETLKKLAQ